MQLTHLLAFALSLATSEAAYKGFNYGATKADGSVKSQSDFESEFSTAKGLVGTAGFTSARLYTMIQGGTANSPISAIPAAIAENTSLLLGLWASGGGMDNELAALKAAISQYGDSFAKLVVGISVGSEDLYRASSEGEKVDAGVGVGPEALVSYIKEVRSIISGTALSSVPIGHVDTWTAWTNGSNSAVIDAVDWLGFDGYPYFQSSMSNSISDAKALFDSSVAQTKAVANGKEVWITETGWPVSGSTQNLAVASLANAKTYWDEPLHDPEPELWCGRRHSEHHPLFNLTCSNTTRPSPSASSSAASSTILSGSAVASGSAIASANPSSSGVVPGATPSTTPGFTVGKGFRPSNSSAAAHYSSASFTGSAYPKFTKTASGSSSTSTSAGSSSDSTSTNSGSSSDSKSTNSSSSSSGSTSVLATGGASSVSSSVFGALVAVLAFAATL
ncbi:glucan endo-1,3-beta-glucosidase eglC [Aspergillus nomiae NRRL 13137]|uniref:Probable glucan endo-1,3-beta-glucosidase eglC n=1 Tax=Aspergillus nomiae NRRL (strain ATCC 15546 / NRRL 13137 / CBS 260.88 / M93) TaxID=1509407 RepID=A0A0L1IS50_ASPN3|nr:glucan endo-1,3-beta-glucosidase eglC [Aspergillus nomiae NRRL 13137]KNG82215.1 glucan endo-1,3-beta-glucosidase eglC [Aspergillus nomiae NRRL 13137]